MRLIWSFVATFAVLPTLALVIPAKPRLGTVVPLTRRPNKLVDNDGVVNREVLLGQVSRVANKMDRGFRAYQKNTGTKHPNCAKLLDKRDTGALPLIDDDEVLWHGTITVGSPPKDFTVDFDTGSSDLFLPGPECDQTCDGHEIYETGASATARDQRKTFTLGFGDGSSVQGEVFTDTVSIANLTVTGQAVGAATQYSTGFQADQFPADGLMGMAFAQISEFELDPVFETMIAQGTTDAPQFSFKLAEEGSELFLGGVNPELFQGEFTNVPITQKGFWQVTMDSANVDGTTAVTNQQAAIDTGTTLIAAPQAQVQQFYDAIPGSKDASQILGDGFFTFPCDADPSVSLTFAGKDFAIPPELFNLGALSRGSQDCVGGIMGVTNIDLWVVGDIFLRNVYSTFDVGNETVGFAELA